MEQHKQVSEQEEELITIPKKSLTWITPAGFLEHYYTYVRQEPTFRKAYEKTEADYKKVFGHTRYAGYQSFLRSKYQYQRKILNKNKTQPNEH